MSALLRRPGIASCPLETQPAPMKFALKRELRGRGTGSDFSNAPLMPSIQLVSAETPPFFAVRLVFWQTLADLFCLSFCVKLEQFIPCAYVHYPNTAISVRQFLEHFFYNRPQPS